MKRTRLIVLLVIAFVISASYANAGARSSVNLKPVSAVDAMKAVQSKVPLETMCAIEFSTKDLYEVSCACKSECKLANGLCLEFKEHCATEMLTQTDNNSNILLNALQKIKQEPNINSEAKIDTLMDLYCSAKFITEGDKAPCSCASRCNKLIGDAPIIDCSHFTNSCGNQSLEQTIVGKIGTN